MIDKLRTIVIFSEERLRKDYRSLIGRVECARIELEIHSSKGSLSEEAIEDLASFDPQVFLIDLPSEREKAAGDLSKLHHHFPTVPILVAGDSYDAAFLIESMRCGVREFIPRPVSSEKLRDSYQRLYRLQYNRKTSKSPATILSFFSAKGGSGSTSIATNFGVSLGRLSKKKILLLDLDTQLGDVASFFGIRDNRYLLAETPGEPILDPAHISKTIVSHPHTGVDILSLTSGYSRGLGISATETKHLLNFLQQDYDFILLDTSNALDESTVAALDSSHLIFLISKCNLPALRNTQRVLHVFDQLGYPRNKVRLLVNRYSKSEDVGLKYIEKCLSFKVFWAIPNDFKSVIQSIQLGEPLTHRNQTVPLARSFYDLSAQVLGIQVDSGPTSPGGGLMVRARDSAAKSLPLTTLNLSKS